MLLMHTDRLSDAQLRDELYRMEKFYYQTKQEGTEGVFVVLSLDVDDVDDTICCSFRYASRLP